ncbi:hypothetical protein O7543_08950 [Solwaraspora sp. WMMA2080]|uniref:hypothetical protein n=1 Tax=unclassified Solwaraspora TaxID=2627926 RepID=UPI00248B6716|nr:MULTISPECIES: hypothetical protein [unclassified Solwaraspora]WBB98890.1 hypothetical protein O7553_08415 [Solwaraspora sp. WMMA2059]WBC22557.1 hypothetical protein O7543_08950 [Solwaraspora sp. WMMA2080]
MYGTLLLQAGLAAAGCGETCSVDELIAQADEVTRQIGDGPNYLQASFGPAAVDFKAGGR